MLNASGTFEFYFIFSSISAEPEPLRTGGGRRPLLATFVGSNRQMLNDIRDSLSHLRKAQLEGDGDLRSDLSQSTSNLSDKAPKKGLSFVFCSIYFLDALT